MREGTHVFQPEPNVKKAEGEGFEPSVTLPPQRFSRPSLALRNSFTSIDDTELPTSTVSATSARSQELGPDLPPDLAAVVAAWDDLPEAIRAGILAMVRASSPPSTETAQTAHRPRRKGH